MPNILKIAVGLFLFLGALGGYLYHANDQTPERLVEAENTMRMTDSMRLTLKVSSLNRRGFETYLMALRTGDEALVYDALDYTEASLGFVFSEYIENDRLVETVVPLIRENLVLIEDAMLEIDDARMAHLRENLRVIHWETEQIETDIWIDFQKNFIEFQKGEYRLQMIYQVIAVAALLVSGVLLLMFLRQTKLTKAVSRNQAELQKLIDLRNRELENLEQARFAAEQASRAKSNFLSNMSHEFRTPLNAVIGFSQVLESQMFGPVGSAKNQEYVSLIRGAGEHLLKLISEILDLSKIEAGEVELEYEEIDLPVLAGECERLVQARASKQGVELTFDVAERLPPLWADRLKVKQILLNLLSNAVKFTPMGGQVRLRAFPAGAGRIALEVTDTGVGIAEEDLARVLLPFEQLENAETRNKEGTGLGLAITQKLVDMHGGTLIVESEVDQGTSVRVIFPARSAGTA
ncbi:MAG: ATP-binding protein [Alphaproteobacteria bacterium]|nr:ATP-binding protein [Alphaproteobacteria bacterium]